MGFCSNDLCSYNDNAVLRSSGVDESNVHQFVRKPALKKMISLLVESEVPQPLVMKAVKQFVLLRNKGWRWDVYNTQSTQWRPWGFIEVEEVHVEHSEDGEEEEESTDTEEGDKGEEVDEEEVEQEEEEGEQGEEEGDDEVLEDVEAAEKFVTRFSLMDRKTVNDRIGEATQCRDGDRFRTLLNWAEQAGNPKEPEKELYRRAAFVPWGPMELARYIVPRLGIDFGVTSGRSTALNAKSIRVAVVRGDATKAETYYKVKDLFPKQRMECVVLDPPFGLNKHSTDDMPWDADRWGYNEVVQLLDALKRKEIVPKDEPWSLAMYLRVEDVGHLVAELETWSNAQAEGYFRWGGQFTMVLGRDGPAHLQHGTRTNGHCQHLLVVKFNNGSTAVKADDVGGGLGGRFIFSFPKPSAESRYLRPEMDAVLVGNGRVPINSTQKSIDEARLIVRLLTPTEGWVLSVCNGTGTAMVAAALEGRNSVGVDASGMQTACCRRRLETFFHKESLLVAALREERHRGSVAVVELFKIVDSGNQPMDDRKTTQGEVALGKNLTDWLEEDLPNYVTGFSKKYAAQAVLAPYTLKCMSVHQIGRLEGMEATKITSNLIPERNWGKKMLDPISQSGMKLPLSEVKKVIGSVRYNESKGLLKKEEMNALEEILWNLIEPAEKPQVTVKAFLSSLPRPGLRRTEGGSGQQKIIAEAQTQPPSLAEGSGNLAADDTRVTGAGGGGSQSVPATRQEGGGTVEGVGSKGVVDEQRVGVERGEGGDAGTVAREGGKVASVVDIEGEKERELSDIEMHSSSSV